MAYQISRFELFHLIPGNDRRVLVGTAGLAVSSIDFVPRPRIRFGDSELDFGTYEVVRKKGYATLKIFNDGTDELIISEITTMDSGNFSVISDEFVIPTGSSQDIKIDFHPIYMGEISENIEIKSNDRDMPVFNLTVRGVGQDELLTLTPSQIQFDDVVLGSYVDTFVVLSNRGNISSKLRNAYFENDSFRLMSDIPDLLLSDSEVKLQLRFIPSEAKGISSRFVVLGEDDSRVEASVDGIGSASELTLSTTSLDFSTVELVSDSLGVVVISNSGNLPLKVKRTVCRGRWVHGCIRESFIVNPAEEYQVFYSIFPKDIRRIYWSIIDKKRCKN